jgi:hypothetical protein
MATQYEVAWNLFCELRKELIESQKIRAQIIGVKITFVSASMGLLAKGWESIPHEILVIPAFAAIFFDFLITSYSFSIKRIGAYCRTHLEPQMRCDSTFDSEKMLWQQFLNEDARTVQIYSLAGNLGLTFLASFVGGAALIARFSWWISGSLLLVLMVGLTVDVLANLRPWQFEDRSFLSRLRGAAKTDYPEQASDETPSV